MRSQKWPKKWSDLVATLSRVGLRVYRNQSGLGLISQGCLVWFSLQYLPYSVDLLEIVGFISLRYLSEALLNIRDFFSSAMNAKSKTVFKISRTIQGIWDHRCHRKWLRCPRCTLYYSKIVFIFFQRNFFFFYTYSLIHTDQFHLPSIYHQIFFQILINSARIKSTHLWNNKTCMMKLFSYICATVETIYFWIQWITI